MHPVTRSLDSIPHFEELFFDRNDNETGRKRQHRERNLCNIWSNYTDHIQTTFWTSFRWYVLRQDLQSAPKAQSHILLFHLQRIQIDSKTGSLDILGSHFRKIQWLRIFRTSTHTSHYLLCDWDMKLVVLEPTTVHLVSGQVKGKKHPKAFKILYSIMIWIHRKLNLV